MGVVRAVFCVRCCFILRAVLGQQEYKSDIKRRTMEWTYAGAGSTPVILSSTAMATVAVGVKNDSNGCQKDRAGEGRE